MYIYIKPGEILLRRRQRKDVMMKSTIYIYIYIYIYLKKTLYIYIYNLERYCRGEGRGGT